MCDFLFVSVDIVVSKNDLILRLVYYLVCWLAIKMCLIPHVAYSDQVFHVRY